MQKECHKGRIGGMQEKRQIVAEQMIQAGTTDEKETEI